MGLVHPLLVVGKVRGRLRPLAVLDLKFADPGWDMVEVTGRILSYLSCSQRYIVPELAWAETLPDDEWSRDVEAEYRQRTKELENLPADCSESRIKELEAEVDRLKNEGLATFVPKFPAIHTCLLLGAISSNWDNTYLHSVGHRPWNSAPNWGGRWMWQPGCTVINLTDLSYAFVLPAEKACDGGDDEPYLALQPISGHQWLTGFGLQSSPKADLVRIYGKKKRASVMSEEALQEVWPSFLQDERNKKDSKDEGSKDKDDKDEHDEDEDIQDEDVKVEDGDIKDENTTSDVKVEDGDIKDENTTSDVKVEDGDIKVDNIKAEDVKVEDGNIKVDNIKAEDVKVEDGDIQDLEPNRFKALSGDQVVEWVESVVTRNAMRGEYGPLELLDLSLNASVTPDHLDRILKVTALKELLIWDHAGLPLEKVAQVADGRIAKVTTRAGFLAPLEKWVRQRFHGAQDPVRIQPVPPMAPTLTPIRQVVWMMLRTETVYTSEPPTDMERQLQVPLGTLSLEDFDVETLATMLHPRRHRTRHRNRIRSELVAFPQHDTWTPLAEVYTSLARIEKFMFFIEMVNSTLTDRWPLIFPLMMAMGNRESEWTVSSPFPTEAFHHAMFEKESFDKPMRIHGPDPIIHGEHTLVFLREPDLDRLRVGLVTRDAAGQLEVHDPAAAARAIGDEEAAEAWESGIGRRAAWTGGEEDAELRYCPDTMLLDPAAVETMWDAAAMLSAQEKEIDRKIGNYHRDGCMTAVA